ncbi:hypothetical protein VMCG_01216 [Cytospora schulzeri]|uniref:Uncharacterized protein n=1 Tax=Cytospora schulzeri TaxID=448051 RepID=A0A423X4Z6_9PEZI|nr:hypothetical protein VMCG_01216 [Valsa malicola]
MAKSKGKKKGGKKDVQEGWKQYFGTNDNNLAKWQQLGRDLGVPEEKLTSKTQIRNVSILEKSTSICDGRPPAEPPTDMTWFGVGAQALKGIWVNIYDFLYHAENKPDDVEFFKSEPELSDYTLRTRKTYPRKNITPGSPLRDLLAHIFSPRGGNKSYK